MNPPAGKIDQSLTAPETMEPGFTDPGYIPREFCAPIRHWNAAFSGGDKPATHERPMCGNNADKDTVSAARTAGRRREGATEPKA